MLTIVGMAVSAGDLVTPRADALTAARVLLSGLYNIPFYCAFALPPDTTNSGGTNSRYSHANVTGK